MTDLIATMRRLFEDGETAELKSLTAEQMARVGEAAQRIASYNTAAYMGELELLHFEREVETAGGYSYCHNR